MTVFITGGSGFLGRALAASLIADGYETVLLTRQPARAGDVPAGVRTLKWDGRSAAGWGDMLGRDDIVMNLAGENLSGGLWTTARKQRIVESRTNAGRAVVEAVQQAQHKPALVIQASGIGHYGPRGDELINEAAGPGDDFGARVTVAWEAATAPVETMGVRRVVLRIAPVLSASGGLLPLMMLPFRFFAGGRMGDGRQGFSWIHLADFVGAVRCLMADSDARGVYNMCAPNPVSNAEFAHTLGQAMRRPAWLPVPALAMRLALGELSSAVLQGQRGYPERLLALGYTFRFPDLEGALRDLLP